MALFVTSFTVFHTEVTVITFATLLKGDLLFATLKFKYLSKTITITVHEKTQYLQ